MTPSFGMEQVVAGEVPDDLTGVRWADGTIECRYRIMHPDGSLVASRGELGAVLTDESVSCDRCSDACG